MPLADTPSRAAPAPAENAAALRAVRLVHTLAWAVFATSIVLLPVCAWIRRFDLASWLVGVVFVEVLVLLVNDWRCPLTAVAARYTSNRRANFDIYLPEWLARHNKVIFGTLYVAGLAFMGWAGFSGT